MQIFSMDHGIKRVFTASSNKDVIYELDRVKNTESILYDAENYDTIEFLDLILFTQNWIDKEFEHYLMEDLRRIVMENHRLNELLDKYYIEYGELEND